MMPVPARFQGGQPIPPSTPRDIREVLQAAERADFDLEYRQVMADAAESLDLSGVLAMLDRWRLVAWSTHDDPEAHRRMLDKAHRLNAGENIATVPWQQVRARLGL